MKRYDYFLNEEKLEVNISPLIDMMFLLLIFFIVTAAFIEEVGVEIKKPKAANALELDQKSIMLAINQNGQVFHGGRQIELNLVSTLVTRLLHSADRPVVITPDRQTHSSVLVDVIDECKQGGAKMVSIGTLKENT